MNKLSILTLTLILGATVIGFKSDVQGVDKSDEQKKAGVGERFCPVHPSDEEVAAWIQEHAHAAR